MELSDTMCSRLAGVLLLAAAAAPAPAQGWDLPARGAEWVTATDEKIKIGFESRGRYEGRTGQAFGKDPDLDTGLYRHRLSVTYKPLTWLKVSGMVQDSRAAWYGPGAPNTLRDQADLQESYLEVSPDSKKGFGMTAGRMMLNYGEARLIGSPQWSNLSRTFDHARVYWRARGAQLEFLLVSPVKIRIGEFNRPVLGDRIWGAYNVFTGLPGKTQLDAYILRHEQNRPGGFTGGARTAGTDRLEVNTFGARFSGPVTQAMKFNFEGAGQNGNVGPATHRGAAGVAWLSRRWMIGKSPFDLMGEYKYASGTADPRNPARVGTFDQMYPANHDKFGHMDLFGWRNIHNARSLATAGINKSVALNLMYNSWWLASGSDSLYSGAGRAIARSASGADGRHVGQETDLFVTYKHKRFAFGAGYGYMFKGEFIRKTTPGVAPSYAYVFHTYSL